MNNSAIIPSTVSGKAFQLVPVTFVLSHRESSGPPPPIENRLEILQPTGANHETRGSPWESSLTF